MARIVRFFVWWNAARVITEWTGAGFVIAGLAGLAVAAIFAWVEYMVAGRTRILHDG